MVVLFRMGIVHVLFKSFAFLAITGRILKIQIYLYALLKDPYGIPYIVLDRPYVLNFSDKMTSY